jgi:hypothetical protein
VPNVQWKTPDDEQRNRPKHVEFLDKNKFGKIGASVGFIKKKKGAIFDTIVMTRCGAQKQQTWNSSAGTLL